MASPRSRWLAAWPGAAAIGVANGALREGTYGRWMPEPPANRLSVLTLIAALGAYFTVLQRRWRLRDTREAVAAGAGWAAMTVAFEFGLGRLQGESWGEMLGAYDVRKGELWPLVLAWIALGPELTRRVTHTTVRPVEERREDGRALVQ